MRGVVSLAAALSIPLTIDGAANGSSFPDRDLFLTFIVILATLVVQGLSLPGAGSASRMTDPWPSAVRPRSPAK